MPLPMYSPCNMHGKQSQHRYVIEFASLNMKLRQERQQQPVPKEYKDLFIHARGALLSPNKVYFHQYSFSIEQGAQVILVRFP